MDVRYYRESSTGQPHVYRHSVTEAEVEQILARPAEDRPGREDSRVVIGQTLAGRYLRVVYVPDCRPNSVFVITAYELSGAPLKAFKRRLRRRQP